MDALIATAQFLRDLGPWGALAVCGYVIKLLDQRVTERDATIAGLQATRVDDEKSRTGFMVAVAKEQSGMLAELTRRRER